MVRLSGQVLKAIVSGMQGKEQIPDLFMDKGARELLHVHTSSGFNVRV